MDGIWEEAMERFAKRFEEFLEDGIPHKPMRKKLRK